MDRQTGSWERQNLRMGPAWSTSVYRSRGARHGQPASSWNFSLTSWTISAIQGHSLSRREASHRPRPVYGKGSPPLASSAMELIMILNRCHRFRVFVYQHAQFSADKKSIEVAVRPRKGSTAVCSRCHLPAPGYDQLAERRFEFIPLCNSGNVVRPPGPASSSTSGAARPCYPA
jgi:hypothetical protein